MAVDTRAKRQSATSVLFILISVIPDNDITSQADRRHVTGIYSGIVSAGVGVKLTNVVSSSRPRSVPIKRQRLQVKVYSSGTTEVNEPALRFAEVLNASAFYDESGGGGYQDAEIFVPRDNPRGTWIVEDMQRLAIYRGQELRWEGFIDTIGDSIPGGAPGNTLRCTGPWGWLMDGPHAPRLDKPWAITDVTPGVWQRIASVSAADLCDIKRTAGTIRFIPKLENWANGQVARVEMSVPTGQTIKRVQFSWGFEEASNSWECFLTNGSGSTIFSLTDDASTTGSEDLAAPGDFTATQTIRFEMRSGASQTSASSDNEYFEINGLIVSTEIGAIDCTQMTIDLIGEHAGLNSSTDLVDTALTRDLETGGGDPGAISTFGKISRFIGGFGDTSNNPINHRLRASTLAATPNGLPLLEATLVPTLDDHEWLVSIDDVNDPQSQVPPIFRRKYIANDGIVLYTLPEGLGYETVTSDDDSNLKDNDKVTADGSRVFVLDAGKGTQADAINAGKARLTQKTKPDFYMSGPIIVFDTIRKKAGTRVDVSEVEPGDRIKIDDYIDDRSDQSNAGLILLITGTNWTQKGRQLSITAGISDDLSLQIQKNARKLLLPTESS